MYTKPISYSGLKLFKKCPRAWASRYIENIKPPTGKAAQRGTDLHAEIEQFFLRGTGYPDHLRPLKPWRQYMEALTLMNPTPEARLAVNERWEPTDFDDPEAYYRGLADLRYLDFPHSTLHIFDWKSGRVYPDHQEQGKTYMALSPEYERYVTHFVYLDLPTEVISWSYTHNDRIQEIRQLKEDIEIIRTTEIYDPKPSRNGCRYCHLSWRDGGSCRAAP